MTDSGSPHVLQRPGGERGAVLLAAVLMLAMAAAVSVALMDRATSVVSELRARRDVLCARYAALGGLALGAPTGSGSAIVGPRVDSLVVTRLRRSSTWCVLRATASCDTASRTLEHTLASEACSTP